MIGTPTPKVQRVFNFKPIINGRKNHSKRNTGSNKNTSKN